MHKAIIIIETRVTKPATLRSLENNPPEIPGGANADCPGHAQP
jgi:hypothetical protein